MRQISRLFLRPYSPASYQSVPQINHTTRRVKTDSHLEFSIETGRFERSTRDLVAAHMDQRVVNIYRGTSPHKGGSSSVRI